jgi:hypothetical protein
VQARISVAVRDTSHPGDASDVIVAALSAARQPGFSRCRKPLETGWPSLACSSAFAGVVFGLLQWWHAVAARRDTAAAETRSAELVSEVASLREQFRGQHEDRQPREQERDRKRRTRETGRPQQEVGGCWQPHCGQVTEMLALIGRRDAALVSLMNAEMRADDQEPPSARSPVTMSACSRAAVSATTASHHMAGTSAAQQIPRRVRGLRSHRRNLAAAYSLRS